MRSLSKPLAVVAVVLLVLMLGAFWAFRGRSGSTWWGGIPMTNINTYGQALPASLPQSSLLDTNGNTVNPRDQIRTAPVTLLVFFATYDTPWSDNVKIAKQVNQDMTKDGVRVIAIDEEETQGTVTAFVATEGLTFTVLRDK